ncbi:unnamed protein product [Caenorhabditis angaria]|uniref:Uncharacterized protein n=1 Tax=Caenorhabditis angaria TaxID=860376 RepID=A0A9P1IW13_9PELO|nr:unnamed protein product [Caenorhabditis angaria]
MFFVIKKRGEGLVSAVEVYDLLILVFSIVLLLLRYWRSLIYHKGLLDYQVIQCIQVVSMIIVKFVLIFSKFLNFQTIRVSYDHMNFGVLRNSTDHPENVDNFTSHDTIILPQVIIYSFYLMMAPGALRKFAERARVYSVDTSTSSI